MGRGDGSATIALSSRSGPLDAYVEAARAELINWLPDRLYADKFDPHEIDAKIVSLVERHVPVEDDELAACFAAEPERYAAARISEWRWWRYAAEHGATQTPTLGTQVQWLIADEMLTALADSAQRLGFPVSREWELHWL